MYITKAVLHHCGNQVVFRLYFLKILAVYVTKNSCSNSSPVPINMLKLVA